MFFKKKVVEKEENESIQFTRLNRGVVEGINAMVAIRKELMSQGAGAEVIKNVEDQISSHLQSILKWDYVTVPKHVADIAKATSYVKG